MAVGNGLIPAHAGKTPSSLAGSRRCKAHPRACGENSPAFMTSSPATGSSPRMRGKRTRGLAEVPAVGLIPAHAGKTRLARTHNPVYRAHPRACGENSMDPHLSMYRQGSSPRMRGKPMGIRALDGCAGLIPAHAGKTGFIVCFPFGSWAHPRACGENGVVYRL